MASIKKVVAQLDAAERQLTVLRKHASPPEVLPVLESLRTALVELTDIVRGDRV